MKKLLSLVMIAIVIVAVSACGGKKNTPEAVAEKYLNHLSKKEYAEAKKLGTEATGQMIDMLQNFPGSDKKADAKKIENIKCETTEDKSTCTYTEDGKPANTPVTLIKKDGNWLVDMKKEGNGENPPPTAPADSTNAPK